MEGEARARSASVAERPFGLAVAELAEGVFDAPHSLLRLARAAVGGQGGQKIDRRQERETRRGRLQGIWRFRHVESERDGGGRRERRIWLRHRDGAGSIVAGDGDRV